MNLVIDRQVSEFLHTRCFVMFRSVCKTHHEDKEAWDLRANKSLVYCGQSAKKTLGLNFLLSRALVFYDTDVSKWLSNIVQWVRYKISINIMHNFIYHHCPVFLYSMDLSHLSLRRRFIWERLWCRNENVYKTLHLSQDGTNKKRRVLCY
jgi:hypothetical protein